MVRVLIADDHAMVRESMRAALELADIEVVGEAGDGGEAVRLAHELRPDVVLMDVAMPVLDGLSAIELVRRCSPETRVMVITGSDDDTLVADAVRAGAAAFLTKVFSMEELISAIRMLAAGEVLLTTDVATSMLRELHHQDGDSPRLTNREEETLQLVATGLSTHDVARRLFISPKTVRNHLAAAYAKLDARDRTEAILSGMRLGIVALA